MSTPSEVAANVALIYEKKKVKLYALSLEYAGRIINEFRANQAGGQYWSNQTYQAVDTMFSKAFMDKDEIGFLLSHYEEYGVYLELANDGKHEAIRPLIKKYAALFQKDVEELF